MQIRPTGGPLLRKVGGGFKGRRAEYKLLFVPAKASVRTDPIGLEGSATTDAIELPESVSKESLQGQPGLTPSVTTVTTEEQTQRTASADADDATDDHPHKQAAEELFAAVFEDNPQRALADAIRWATDNHAKHPYAYVLGAIKLARGDDMDEFEALRHLAEAHDWGLTDQGAA